MTAGSPEADRLAAISRGDVLLLDTSALIAYLSGREAVSAEAEAIIDGLVATGRNPGVISAISVAELMVRPLRQTGELPPPLRSFLLGFPNITVRSTDFLVAAEAARIRAFGASLPDALIAATAALTSCRWLITNDQALRDRLSGLEWQTEVLLLSELTAPGA